MNDSILAPNTETDDSLLAETQFPLNTPLSLFNHTDGSDFISQNTQSSDLLLSCASKPRSSQSIDLKSFIESDNTNQSDLWEMQSIHTSFAITEEEEITKAKDTTSKTLELSPPKEFMRLRPIKTDILSSFESFVPNDDESEFIHFQGTLPPICTFQTVRCNRQYFKMLIPPIYENQNILLLCCRKKKNIDKFRFSSDEFKMEKKNNPYYIGKMKLIKRKNNQFVTFKVTLKNEKDLCLITINVEPNNSHSIKVNILSNDNLIEFNDENGKIMKGTINNFVSAKLNLNVSSSNRRVLNITDCINCIENELKEAQNKWSAFSNVQTIDFDYPLSIFLAFAIASAVNCRHHYI